MCSSWTQALAACRLSRKHSRQKIGLPCVGRKGTVVSLPHWEHTALVSIRVWPERALDPSTATLFDLHVLQRLGSLRNCLSWKNDCSPAVKTKSAPQSTHFSTL